MFSTKTANIQTTEFTSNYMEGGINENVTLKEVNVKKSPTGRDFLEVVFENSEGQIASMSEWKNEKNAWVKTDEDLQKRDNIQFGRLMQIINCYYPEVEEAELSSFVEMINWVANKLNPMIATKKPLRLKVVYDKNNYTTISKNGIFVEPMSVTESQIRKFKRDDFERTIVADTEVNDPFNSQEQAEVSTDATIAANNSDLPF